MLDPAAGLPVNGMGARPWFRLGVLLMVFPDILATGQRPVEDIQGVQ